MSEPSTLFRRYVTEEYDHNSGLNFIFNPWKYLLWIFSMGSSGIELCSGQPEQIVTSPAAPIFWSEPRPYIQLLYFFKFMVILSVFGFFCILICKVSKFNFQKLISKAAGNKFSPCHQNSPTLREIQLRAVFRGQLCLISPPNYTLWILIRITLPRSFY